MGLRGRRRSCESRQKKRRTLEGRFAEVASEVVGVGPSETRGTDTVTPYTGSSADSSSTPWTPTSGRKRETRVGEGWGWNK